MKKKSKKTTYKENKDLHGLEDFIDFHTDEGGLFREEDFNEMDTIPTADPSGKLETFKAVEIEPVEIMLTPSSLAKLPLIYLDEAIAVPHIFQQLPQSAEENEEVIAKSIQRQTPVLALFRSECDKEEPFKYCAHVGVVGLPVRYEDIPRVDGMPIFLFQGNERVIIDKFYMEDGQPFAQCSLFPIDFDITEEQGNVIIHEMYGVYDRLIKLSGHPEFPSLEEATAEASPIQAFFYAFFSAPIYPKDKQKVFEHPTISEIMKEFLLEMTRAEQYMILREDIRRTVQKDLDENNRENYLRQEMAVIREELGDTEFDEIEAFRERAKKKKWGKETQTHFDKELKRLQRYPSNTPDYGIQSTYIDTLLSLPWREFKDPDFDFNRIAEVLDRDHFGLERVKERILEQMAVAKLRSDNRAPIICLVGPPGVGKTSLGKSIAEAMGREYARVSFGGMHDEAEIRGHRRTYLGAMPGRLIAALMKLKSSNPVMVLDEIDKIGRDFKGDPSSALLEVLDPEQNSRFHDNYIDTDYDLSNIFFIATANTLDSVSVPLLDRMEIISIPGYITAEKVEIASRHLLPKELKANGFDENEISFEEDALAYLIDYYTRESGVRKLEKSIAKILRKLAVRKVRGEEYPSLITRAIVKALLGKEENNPERYENNDSIGVVTGLAWTSVGGEILFIESSVTDGKGKLTLTGNLGDVMKESATLALQYVRAHASLLGIETERFEKSDVHIHVPEGAIPKDGPSAGITMATSLASAFTGRKVKSHLAMTGEITLRGKVLPVGGIKEKIIAAKRAGIKEIILSSENEKDISEIAERYVKGLTFTYVDTIEQVLERALLEK